MIVKKRRVSNLANLKRKASWIVGATSALFCGTSFAQNLVLEEVIVTATKRAESTQTIPLSITAISGDVLEAQGAIEFFDYATRIPNLSFGAATDGVLAGRSISLRGIAGLNTTGVYIDDTPISESIDPRLLDLDRIEVLRGPQGTLYGARSLGGTIRQITAKPSTEAVTSKFRASLSSTDESDDLNFLASGTVNLPLSDTVALKLSGLYEDRGGFFDRQVGTIADFLEAPATLAGAPTLVNEDVDSQTVTAVSADLLIQPNDNLTIRPRIMYQDTDLDGFPLADIDPENFDQNRPFDTEEFGEDEWVLGTLNINYDTGYGSFTSATSYFDRDTFEGEQSAGFINFLQALPGDFGGFGLTEVIGQIPVNSPIFRELTFETFVQEFRFASDFEGPFNFVVGAFYQDIEEERNFEPRNVAFGLQDNFGQFFDAVGLGGIPVLELFPFGETIFNSFNPSDTEELGFFGEFTYDFTDKLSVLFGARYFDTEFSFTQIQGGLAAGVPLPGDTPLSTVPPEFGSQEEDGEIFKIAVEYELSDSVFLYGLAAEGFRIGGANTVIPPTLGCPEDLAALGLSGVDTSQFQSDDLTNYELGLKADLTPATRLNATLFFIDFDQIQQSVQLACGFQFVGNFGAAESQGVELELTSQLSQSLTLSANLGYTDAEFTETVAGGLVNADGDPLQFVPEFTAAFSLDYLSAAPVYGDMQLFGRIDASYVDDSLSLVNGIPRIRESYEQVGLRFGLQNEKYTITIFANNLTDEIANLADNRSLAAETPGRPRFVVSRPRTFGIEVNARF